MPEPGTTFHIDEEAANLTQLLPAVINTPVNAFSNVVSADADPQTTEEEKSTFYEVEDKEQEVQREVGQLAMEEAAVTNVQQQFMEQVIGNRQRSDNLQRFETSRMDWHQAQAWARDTSGPGKKSIVNETSLEETDAKHRMGDYLFVLFQEYMGNVAYQGHPFFTWVDSLRPFGVIAILKRLKPHWQINMRATLAFMKGVQYLDETSRGQYAVRVTPRGLMWRGKVFDTVLRRLSTIFSGKGWAIWVLSPNGRLYTNSHIKGEFQHSSFLAGGKVDGAGEWQVRDGEITKITGKSGHYQPNVDDFVDALRTMEDKGVNLRETVALLNESGKTVEIPVRALLHGDAAKNPFLSTNLGGSKGAGGGFGGAQRDIIGSHREGA
jgi:hypothetical protein